MHISINSMLEISGKIAADGTISKNVLEGTIASVCGINTLQMGVAGGIIVGSWCCGTSQPFPQDRTAECVIILRRFQIRTDHFNDYLYVRRNRNVFRMANRAERYLMTPGSLVTGTGYFGTLIFGIVKRALIPFGLHHDSIFHSGRQLSAERWKSAES